MATRFIFPDFLMNAINEFKNPDDRLKAYEAITDYAINGVEPTVTPNETTEVDTVRDEQDEGRIVKVTTYTATYDNSFMALFIAAKSVIDAGIKELDEKDALEAKYKEYIERTDAFFKQQEENKSEEQTDTYGKPDTVSLTR